jgi:hypothetical protein
MIKIKRLDDYERKIVHSFFNKIYKNKRDLLEWEWEFLNNPLGRSIFVTAVEADAIIGTQAIILANLTLKGQKVLSGKSEETLVDHQFRGMGIFKKMYELIFDEAHHAGVKILWGFTGAVKPFRNVGFDIKDPLRSFWLVLSIGTSFKHICIKQDFLKRKRYSQIIKLFLGLVIIRLHYLIKNSMQKIILRNNRHLNKYKTRNLNQFDHDTDKCFLTFIKDYPDIITLWRTHDYMNWRTIRNPHGEHTIIGLYFENKLVGNMVFGMDLINKVLNIVDVIVLKDHAVYGLTVLFDRIVNLAQREQCGFISFELIPSKNTFCIILKEEINKKGFYQMPYSYPTVLKIVSEEQDKDFLCDINNWYVNSLFTEGAY